jgi:hypothetical protein
MSDLTPATLAALQSGHLPSDTLAGLLDDWIGPCRVLADGRRMAGVVADTSGEGGVRILLLAVYRQVWVQTGDLGRVTLESDRPEVRSQIARVMAARGTPIWHLLPTSEGGTLPASYVEHSAALIACSVARVAVGLGPVVDVLGPYRYGCRPAFRNPKHDMASVSAPFARMGGAALTVAKKRAKGTVVPWRWTFGAFPEMVTGTASDEAGGKSAADAAALAAGFALAADALVLPWPVAHV